MLIVSAIRTLVLAPNSVYGGGIWTLMNHKQNSADSSSFRKEQSVEIIVTLVALELCPLARNINI